jgi:hypothetical protein
MNDIPESAKWKGPPTKERIDQIKREYFYDEYNTLGNGYGVMYHLTADGHEVTRAR